MAYRPAVLAARRRRNRARKASGVRFEWFIEEVTQKVRLTIHRRVAIAGQFLQSFDRPITPEIISRISLGEYDNLIEQIWHNSAANEGYYGIGGSKNL